MRKLIAVAAMAAMSLAAVTVAEPTKSVIPMPAGTRAAERIRDLNLTDAQELAIAGIREEYAPKVEDAVEHLTDVIKDAKEAAKAVLTTEQQLKLATLKEEMKLWRSETVVERFAHLRDLDLTEAEQAKIADIRKDFRPRIVKSLEGLKGILTPEQAKLREESLKAGMARRDVIASLKLTDEQKAKVEVVGTEVKRLVREEMEKIRDVLNPDQREKLATMKEERREQLRARTLFGIATLKELNLTDPQVLQLRAIHMDYGTRIEEAGNQLRAIVREELTAIWNVLKT